MHWTNIYDKATHSLLVIWCLLPFLAFPTENTIPTFRAIPLWTFVLEKRKTFLQRRQEASYVIQSHGPSNSYVISQACIYIQTQYVARYVYGYYCYSNHWIEGKGVGGANAAAQTFVPALSERRKCYFWITVPGLPKLIMASTYAIISRGTYSLYIVLAMVRSWWLGCRRVIYAAVQSERGLGFSYIEGHLVSSFFHCQNRIDWEIQKCTHGTRQQSHHNMETGSKQTRSHAITTIPYHP